MATPNALLMLKARQSLAGKWESAALITVAWFAIVAIPVVVPIVGWIVRLLIKGPLALGLYTFFLCLVRGREGKVEQLFGGFSRFGVSCIASLAMLVLIVLWTLLLIVPGIIAILSYSMTFFIIADNPHIDAFVAIEQSKRMMRGQKWKLFCLWCRFLGWIALGIITLGIGFAWVGPYLFASYAAFYQDLLDASPG